MDDARVRGERLLTLSSTARRLADLVAAAEAPPRFEVLRHALRVPEGDAIDALREATAAGLVRRGGDTFTYVPYDDATGAAIRDGIDAARLARLRARIASASARVFEE